MSSLMFGHGKFNAGILVDPRPEYAFEPSDDVKLANFRNDIWYLSTFLITEMTAD